MSLILISLFGVEVKIKDLMKKLIFLRLNNKINFTWILESFQLLEWLGKVFSTILIISAILLAII